MADIFTRFQYSNIPDKVADVDCQGRKLIPKVMGIEARGYVS